VAPKINDQIQLDDIYKVFPRFSRVPKQVPLSDPRFPTLRFVLQTSRQDLDGIIKFTDFLVYDYPGPLRRLKSIIDPKTPNTILLNPEDKEITLSQYNIINTGYLVGHRGDLNEEDVVFTTLALHNSYGLSLGMGLAVSHMTKLMWASELFDADKVVAGLSTERATVLIAQPNELESILDKITPKTNLTALKKVFVVSSPGNLPTQDLLHSVKARLNALVLVTFGTNETGGVITTTTYDTVPATNLVGKPLPHTEIQIVDNQDKPVPLNTTGELLVKGFNITSGFRNDSLLTSQKIKNGYLHTGIRAKLDSNQNLIIDMQ